MKTTLKIGIMVAIMILGTAFLGAQAFNQLTADRQASIDVVSDNQGILILSPGQSPVVTLQQDELRIDTAVGNSAGVNVNSTLVVGDSSQPTSTPAFSVTNNGGEVKNISFAYSMNDAGVNNDDLTFEVYDSTGTSIGTFDGGANVTASSVSSGETLYVVFTADTTGLSTTNTLSGTLSVSAS